MNDIQLRRRGRCFRLSIAVLLTLIAAPVLAEGAEFAVSLGWYEPDRPEDAIEVAFDVHYGPELFWGIRPQAGLLATSEGTVYGWSGFRVRLPIRSERWRIDLSSGVGLFDEGDGKDLGGVVEFRSGIDVLRQFKNGQALGLGFHHISNAGIYDKNPGSNTLLVRWVFGRTRK